MSLPAPSSNLGRRHAGNVAAQYPILNATQAAHAAISQSAINSAPRALTCVTGFQLMSRSRYIWEHDCLPTVQGQRLMGLKAKDMFYIVARRCSSR
ncbi:hypothetical protein PILCRDRAFT_815429 [Piloderma croceum F 1598]|uniref:Uncharacterized protein n=1 Tax=Piloderma croceum (strain F 1598) TaxID=765440 RepID=A0A0C3FS85_PILCF|nr:hypothetical protein PILCRDRAFT_815429 [Piloderma croceum F 1598]